MRRFIAGVLRLLRVRTPRVAQVQADLRGMPANQQELRRPVMNGYNFTERVRKVLALAREEAGLLQHEYVGTEHILLALIREGEGVAMTALQNLKVDTEALRAHVLGTVKPGNTPGHGRDLPYTSRAKKVLELAMIEARGFNHSYVGTEHLLLGLVDEKEGVAAQALAGAGIERESLATEIIRIIGPWPAESSPRGIAIPDGPRKLRDPWRFLPEPARSIVEEAFRAATARDGDRPTEADLLSALVSSSRGVAAAFSAREIELDALVAEIRRQTESPDSSG